MKNKPRLVASLIAAAAIALVVLAGPAARAQTEGEVAHGELLSEDAFPTASQCAVCHQRIYDEWSSSNHAYASISPMFHKFEQAIIDLTQGTIGTFCVRCHQGGGTNLGEPREAALWERAQISREGVSCVICHRVEDNYTKANAERYIVAKVTADALFMNWDEERGAVWEAIATRRLQRVMSLDKKARLGGVRTLAIHLGANTPQLRF